MFQELNDGMTIELCLGIISWLGRVMVYMGTRSACKVCVWGNLRNTCREWKLFFILFGFLKRKQTKYDTKVVIQNECEKNTQKIFKSHFLCCIIQDNIHLWQFIYRL